MSAIPRFAAADQYRVGYIHLLVNKAASSFFRWAFFGMLEPDEAKVSRPVLRGLAPSNGGWPLGTQAIDGARTCTLLDSQHCRLLPSQIVPTAASFPAGQLRRFHPSSTRVVTFARIGYASHPTTGNWRHEDFHLARFAALSAAPYGPVLLLMPFGSHLTVDTLPSGEQQAVALGPSWL